MITMKAESRTRQSNIAHSARLTPASEFKSELAYLLAPTTCSQRWPQLCNFTVMRVHCVKRRCTSTVWNPAALEWVQCSKSNMTMSQSSQVRGRKLQNLCGSRYEGNRWTPAKSVFLQHELPIIPRFNLVEYKMEHMFVCRTVLKTVDLWSEPWLMKPCNKIDTTLPRTPQTAHTRATIILGIEKVPTRSDDGSWYACATIGISCFQLPPSFTQRGTPATGAYHTPWRVEIDL